jgi:cytochrome c oxidase subunit 2
MATASQNKPQRVLIVSSHALFGEGLRSLLKTREIQFDVVGLVSTVVDASEAIETQLPDTVIVDYDDDQINREELFARIAAGTRQMRLVLLSLKEGPAGSEAVVYDRRTMAASEMEEWLEGWTEPEAPAAPIETPEFKPRRGSMKHLIIAGFLVIIVTLALGSVLTPENLLPIQASRQAVPIDQLFGFQFWAISFLFSLIVVFMLYSLVAFRRKKGETGDGVHMHGNTTLEVTWTLIPLGTVIGLAFWGAQILGETMRVNPEATEINVVASQWNWRFEYPEEGIISSELVLPVDQQALLLLSSQDVIHSFWVPEFRVKQDAIPGGEDAIRELRITPSEIGDYTVRCAELCGQLHTTMLAPVRVVSQGEYTAWIEEQINSVPDDPVLRGQQWAQNFGCIACHSVDGSDMVGPTWLGTFGSAETLEDGSTVQVDEAYLLESIRNPAAKIVQGFQNVMPANIAEGMTDDQVQDVIEYIKSLQ